MNILILTGKFGMGHWSASQSLRQQLLRAFPGAEVEVLDFVAEAMPNASEAMYKCFNLLVTRGSGLFNLYYKLTQDLPADARPLFETLFLDKLEELVAARRPDAVIATHPSAPGWCPAGRGDGERPAPHHLRHRPVQPFRVDSQIHRLLSGGLQRHPHDRLAAKGVDRDIICVTGIPVRCEFKRPVRRRPGRERNLLIMGGGLGLLPKRDSFYEALDALPGVHTTIITGNNRKLYDRLAGKYAHIEVLGFTDRVYDYMARADLVLTKPGGITLFETIFSELPILAWEPFLEQEKNNARFLVKRGLGRVAAKEPEECLSAIRALIYDDETLEWMAGNMRAMKGQLEEESLNRMLAGLEAEKGVRVG
ncbi:MAG: MGDG synthase family glycosyltransferase [Flavonifractor plautii]